MAEGPPVTTRLPVAVYLTVASCTCGGEMPLSCLFSSWQISPGADQESVRALKFSRFTMRLGLGALVPAIAEYRRVRGLECSLPFC